MTITIIITITIIESAFPWGSIPPQAFLPLTPLEKKTPPFAHLIPRCTSHHPISNKARTRSNSKVTHQLHKMVGFLRCNYNFKNICGNLISAATHRHGVETRVDNFLMISILLFPNEHQKWSHWA